MPTGVGAGIRSREGREGAACAARRDGSLRSTPHPGYERDMPFLTHAGVSLRYDRTGSGPPVLLVHGWTCNRTFWERQVVALRDRHSVVTVDVRGHGESSHPRTGYTIGAMAADLEHLVLVLELAQRLGERVSALGLVCTTAGGLADAKNPLAEPERAAEMKKAIAADFRAFARDFAARLFKDPHSPLLSWAVGQLQKTPPHVAEACFDAVLAADFRSGAKKLKVPTAVLHGKHDALLPLAHGEDLAKKIPGAKLTVFAESGHAPFLEEPEAFNAALAK